MALPSEPLPLFSPTTQVAVSSSEQVLHSIFSPTLQGGVTSHIVRKSRQAEKRERIARASKRLKPKLPISTAAESVTFVNKSQNSPLADSPDEFFSPVGNNTLPITPRTASKAALKTPANLARGAFRTPGQESSPDFASPVSTVSALTKASPTTSSIPIDMLGFDYVSNCHSPKTLQDIVASLSAGNGSQHYPALLRKAKAQLEIINEQTAVKQETVQPSHLSNSPEECQGDHTLYMSPSKDESSLALSLSSSVLDGVDAAVSLSNTVPIPASAKVNNIDQFIATKMKEPTAPSSVQLESKADSGRIVGSTLVDGTQEEKLQAEIDQLSNEIRALSSSKEKERADLQCKLRTLEATKNEAERKVSVLEMAVACSSTHERKATAKLENLREESRQLKEKLSKERVATESKVNQAKAAEEGLRRKIHSLSVQLDQCKEQSANVTKETEWRLRRKLEHEYYSKRDVEVKSLQQSLQNAQTTLRAMKQERSNTLRSIHQALGKPTDRIDLLSAKERKATVESISKNLSSKRAETKALSKALNKAETDRDRLLEARSSTKKRLNESMSRCRRFERENELLTKRIQELNDELESSRVDIDMLLQQQQERDDEWKKKEADYENIIGKLKSQLRSGETMVSLALYRKAVDEAHARARECQDKRIEVNAMSRKVQALERRLADEKSKRQQGLTPLDSRPLRVNLRKVTPGSGAKPDENSDPNHSCPKTPRVNQRKSSHEKRHQPPPLTPRMSAVREAGGRKGLCAKLKQMRRSPLVNKSKAVV